MPPVQRRYSKRPVARRYEVKSPAIVIEIMLLKAVTEPRPRRDRIQEMMAVKITDEIGTEVCELTFDERSC